MIPGGGFMDSTPMYYRLRAVEMRRLAEKASPGCLHDSYLEIAINWDRLAEQAEAVLTPSPNVGLRLKL